MDRIEVQPRRGDALDFGRPKQAKARKEANPIIWGAWGGIIAATIGTIASFNHQLNASQTVWGFGMGGLFWMGAVAQIKNWLGRRLAR